MTSSPTANRRVLGVDASQRWVVFSIVAVLTITSVFAIYLLFDPFEGLPDDPDVTVSLAGSFPSEDDEPLDQPLGIVLDGSRVLVAESGTGTVRIFSRFGRARGEIPFPETDGVPARPIALAIADRGRIAVVDSTSNDVLVVGARRSREPRVIFSLGDVDTAPVRPTGVAFADGLYYVSESADPAVRVYDSEGRFVRDLGGSIEPRIEHPGGIYVREGVVYLSDTKTGLVVLIDAVTDDSRGAFDDVYLLPRALAAAGDGTAVADALAQAASVCDADGSPTHTINADSVPEMPLVMPEGVAWDRLKSRLYVTDSVTGRVVAFNVRAR